jgi:hypothetical protein
VRCTLGELVRRGPGALGSAAGAGVPGFAPELDTGRADSVVPVLRLLLGLEEPNGIDADDVVGVAR